MPRLCFLACLWVSALGFLALPSFSQQKAIDLETLLELEKKITAVAEKVSPATVGVKAGRGLEGSGVIVTAEGLVLTAAHVFRRPGDRIRIVIPSKTNPKGRVVNAVALGKQDRADFGMIKITDKGPFPFVEMGDSSKLPTRQLCIATGHPGGFQTGRPPVLRFGSIGRTSGLFIQSTCIINSGDSGGPLFDLDGKLIGIHSRIRDRESLNYHVPISTIRANWKRLLASEDWTDGSAYLGLRGQDHEKGCQVETVYRQTPAREGGLRQGDIITKVDGKAVKGIEDLRKEIRSRKPRQKVVFELLRGDQTIKKTIRLGVEP